MARDKFEYRVWQLKLTIPPETDAEPYVERELNMLGEEGWEVFSLHYSVRKIDQQVHIDPELPHDIIEQDVFIRAQMRRRVEPKEPKEVTCELKDCSNPACMTMAIIPCKPEVDSDLHNTNPLYFYVCEECFHKVVSGQERLGISMSSKAESGE